MWTSLLIAIVAAVLFWSAVNVASYACSAKAADTRNQTPSNQENTSASHGTDTSETI